MIINTNMSAIRGVNNLSRVNSLKEQSLQRLSSGKRINSAKDDSAGCAISTKLNSQIKGLDQAIRNTKDGESMVSTAEAIISEVVDILQRVRELCVQGANDTYSEKEREKIKSEIDQLTSELDRIAETSNFNGITLLDGSLKGAGAVNLQVGANEDQVLTLEFPGVDSNTLGLGAIAVDSFANATASITVIDTALESISTDRATLGAMQNRLQYTVSNLSSMQENITAAESRISDVDMAKEMISYSKTNILSQTSNNMLSMALQVPNSILQLLQQ